MAFEDVGNINCCQTMLKKNKIKDKLKRIHFVFDLWPVK